METVLAMLKFDLGITHTARDTFFNNLILSQQKELEAKGFTFNLTVIEDIMLLSDYSVWIYRNRDKDVDISKNLQLRIRNRVVKERSNDI